MPPLTPPTPAAALVMLDAATLALCLRSGVLALDAVHTWADGQLLAAAEGAPPPGAVLDLCTVPSTAEALSLLHVLAAEAPADPGQAVQARAALVLLGQALHTGALGLDQAAAALAAMAEAGCVPDAPAAQAMAWWAEALALVDAGDLPAPQRGAIAREIEALLQRCAGGG